MYNHSHTQTLESNTGVSAMCMLAATGLSQSGVMPSPSQEQLQEQASEVTASAHSWTGSKPEQSDVPLTVASSQPLSAQTSDNAASGARQQQQPANLADVDLAAASDAAIDNALAAAAAGSLTIDEAASEAAVDIALAAAAGSLTDDLATSEAAAESVSAAAAAESLTADAPQAGSSQYVRPLSPGSALLGAAQEQRQGINGALTAAESSTAAAAPQAESSQSLRTQIPDKALLTPADPQQPADLTQDLAASEAADASALAAAVESLAADAPQPDSRQRLRTQISNNAQLTPREQRQPADLTEDLAASEAAVDSALAAAADSLTAAVPQLDSRQYVRPLSPGSALLRAAQLQRHAIDNALAAAAGAGGDSMRSRNPELSAAEQVDLTNELTRSKAAVEAALTEARESELAAAAAAAAGWNSVQGEAALPLSTAPNSQLPVGEASLEPMTEDPSAAAAAESAPASVIDDSRAFSPFAAPSDLSPMAAERIKAAIAQGAGLAFPSSSSSDPFLTAEDTAAAAAQELDQAVARLKDDEALSGSLTDAAAEDIAAAAGVAADEAESGSGPTPYGGWVSDTQSGLGMAASSRGTPVPGVPSVVPPPAELSQEVAADLQEIQALRSQVRLA